MRIEQFYYVIEVAKWKSISIAAEELYVSQPTISQSINSLEIELGKKIFDRSRSGTIPTEFGKMIIEKSEKLINIIDEINESVIDSSNRLNGTLSIKGVPGFYLKLLPQTLVKYIKKFPGVTLNVYDGGSLVIEQEILRKEIDIGFVAVDNPYYFSNNNKIVFEQILSGKIMAYVGYKSPLAHRESISIEELINYPIISLQPGYQMYDTITQSLKQYGEPKLLFHSGNSLAGKQIVSEGVGVGFCSSITVKKDPYFESGNLIAIPLDEEDLNLYYGYIRLNKKHSTREMKEFIKMLKSELLNQL